MAAKIDNYYLLRLKIYHSMSFWILELSIENFGLVLIDLHIYDVENVTSLFYFPEIFCSACVIF